MAPSLVLQGLASEEATLRDLSTLYLQELERVQLEDTLLRRQLEQLIAGAKPQQQQQQQQQPLQHPPQQQQQQQQQFNLFQQPEHPQAAGSIVPTAAEAAVLEHAHEEDGGVSASLLNMLDAGMEHGEQHQHQQQPPMLHLELHSPLLPPVPAPSFTDGTDVTHHVHVNPEDHDLAPMDLGGYPPS
jgi:hypothetical protein